MTSEPDLKDMVTTTQVVAGEQLLAATLSAHESAVFGVHVPAGVGDAGWPFLGSGAARRSGRPAGVDPLIPGLCCVLPWEGLGGMAPSGPAGGQ
jgi:hypothetical protein